MQQSVLGIDLQPIGQIQKTAWTWGDCSMDCVCGVFKAMHLRLQTPAFWSVPHISESARFFRRPSNCGITRRKPLRSQISAQNRLAISSGATGKTLHMQPLPVWTSGRPRCFFGIAQNAGEPVPRLAPSVQLCSPRLPREFRMVLWRAKTPVRLPRRSRHRGQIARRMQ